MQNGDVVSIDIRNVHKEELTERTTGPSQNGYQEISSTQVPDINKNLNAKIGNPLYQLLFVIRGHSTSRFARAASIYLQGVQTTGKWPCTPHCLKTAGEEYELYI